MVFTNKEAEVLMLMLGVVKWLIIVEIMLVVGLIMVELMIIVQETLKIIVVLRLLRLKETIFNSEIDDRKNELR